MALPSHPKGTPVRSPSLLSPQEIGMAPALHEIKAVRVRATIAALNAQYEDLLEEMIFPNPRPGLRDDGKTLARYEKCLRSDEAHSILSTIWKESGPFADPVLDHAGVHRGFTRGTLNTWNMATRLTNKPEHVARINSQIRSIALAAEAYGLIDRTVKLRKIRPIQATNLLHVFMMTLSHHNVAALLELHAFLFPSDSSADFPAQ